MALAEHSCRVAELCVSTAQVFMSHEGCFLIEVAALLHDLGKLGLPEQILKKPAPLTAEEWQQLRTHDRTGVEIVAAAFGSKALTEIVRSYHGWYQGNPRDRNLPRGDEIPLAVRILAIADAFDTMVFARYYGTKRTREEALAEIRRCAPQQFDPRLVDRFVEVVHASDRTRQPNAPVRCCRCWRESCRAAPPMRRPSPACWAGFRAWGRGVARSWYWSAVGRGRPIAQKLQTVVHLFGRLGDHEVEQAANSLAYGVPLLRRHDNPSVRLAVRQVLGVEVAEMGDVEAEQHPPL